MDKKFILFSAPWCSGCKPVKQYIEANSLEVEVINVDEEPTKVQQYGIRGIPALVCESEGATTVGMQDIMKILKEI